MKRQLLSIIYVFLLLIPVVPLFANFVTPIELVHTSGDENKIRNFLYRNFASLGGALQIEADSRGLQGDEKISFLAQHYSRINSELYSYYDKNEPDNGAAVSGLIEIYLKKHNLHKALEVFKAEIKKG